MTSTEEHQDIKAALVQESKNSVNDAGVNLNYDTFVE